MPPTKPPSYTPILPDPSELDDWQHHDVESTSTADTRNHPITIHRRPGFYSRSLLCSVGLNAVLLMLVGWQWMKIRSAEGCVDAAAGGAGGAGAG